MRLSCASQERRIDIDYSQRILLLRVRDDGVGLDSKLLIEGRRLDITGCRVCGSAQKVSVGNFEFWSRIQQGTEWK